MMQRSKSEYSIMCVWLDTRVSGCLPTVGSVAIFGQQNLNTVAVDGPYFGHNSQYDALNNGDFTISATVTATDDAHPRSYLPMYFTSGVSGDASTVGIAMGDDYSQSSLPVAMADGTSGKIRKFFEYPAGVVNEHTGKLSLHTQYIFELRCAKTASARLCCLTVNGVYSSSGTLTFACAGNIYNRCT